MPTNFYDVIVTGDDLAGLIAATLCARRGLRVLVVETAATPPEKLVAGPYALPRTPMPFVGESSPAIRRVVAELNFIQTLKRRLTALRPSFQVVLPDARIEVSADGEGFFRDLDRELSAEREVLDAFFARAAEVSRVLEPVLGQDVTFPPEGFWEKREIARSEARLPALDEDLLPGVPAGHPARALVALPAAFGTASDPRALTPTAIARTFDLWRRGTARLDGGRDALRQMLLEKLRTQHAGEVQVVDPTAITTKWGKAQGLALRDRQEFGAQQLLCGAPLGEAIDLLADRAPKRMLQLARAIQPTAYRYVLNLVVGAAGIPEGISPITFVCADPDHALVGDNAFAIFVGEPDDNGRVAVTVVANAPAPGDGETLDDVLAALRPRLLARLEDVMPFCTDHAVVIHSPNQARPPVAPDGTEVGPRVAPTPPEPLWTSSLPTTLGVGALPYDVGLKSLTAASTQVLPGLGLEGDFTTAWCAARIVSAATGKKKDYLKDEILLGS